MVGGEDQPDRPLDPRAVGALPAGDPRGELVEPGERPAGRRIVGRPGVHGRRGRRRRRRAGRRASRRRPSFTFNAANSIGVVRGAARARRPSSSAASAVVRRPPGSPRRAGRGSARPSSVSGCTPRPTSLLTTTVGAPVRPRRVGDVGRGVVDRARRRRRGAIRLPTHSVRQSTMTSASSAVAASAAGEVERLLDRRPRPVARRGGGRCVVRGRRRRGAARRDERHRPVVAAAELDGERALAAARAAEQEGQHDRSVSSRCRAWRDAAVVRVLDLAHLGDRVGDLDQLGGASRPVTTTLTCAGRSRDRGDDVVAVDPAPVTGT